MGVTTHVPPQFVAQGQFARGGAVWELEDLAVLSLVHPNFSGVSLRCVYQLKSLGEREANLECQDITLVHEGSMSSIDKQSMLSTLKTTITDEGIVPKALLECRNHVLIQSRVRAGASELIISTSEGEFSFPRSSY